MTSLYGGTSCTKIEGHDFNLQYIGTPKVLDTLLCLEMLRFSDGSLVSTEDFEYFIGSKC